MTDDNISRLIAATRALSTAVSQLGIAVDCFAKDAADEVAAFAEFKALACEVADEFGGDTRRGTIVALPSRGEPSPPAA